MRLKEEGRKFSDATAAVRVDGPTPHHFRFPYCRSRPKVLIYSTPTNESRLCWLWNRRRLQSEQRSKRKKRILLRPPPITSSSPFGLHRDATAHRQAMVTGG